MPDLQRDAGAPEARVALRQEYDRPNGARSRHALFEFDCSAERWRALSIADHPELMSGGTAFGKWAGESEWSYIAARAGTNIPASTTNRTILRFVCSQ